MDGKSFFIKAAFPKPTRCRFERARFRAQTAKVSQYLFAAFIEKGSALDFTLIARDGQHTSRLLSADEVAMLAEQFNAFLRNLGGDDARPVELLGLDEPNEVLNFVGSELDRAEKVVTLPVLGVNARMAEEISHVEAPL